jgi:hypothetical protein
MIHRVLTVFFVALLSSAPAAAAPPRPSTGDVLARAGVLVLARTLSQTADGVEVERVEAVAGEVPARFTVVQPGPRRHALPLGADLLLPLEASDDGRWHYRAETVGPAVVDRRHSRAALAFARAWRRDAGQPPEAMAARWIALLDHPAEVARRAAAEALTRHAPALFGRLRDVEIDALVATVTRPGLGEDARRAALRALDVLGGRRGADALARRFADLPASTAVQQLAVTLIARHGTPTTRAALLRCVEESGPAVAARCRRFLGDGGTPRTP